MKIPRGMVGAMAALLVVILVLLGMRSKGAVTRDQAGDASMTSDTTALKMRALQFLVALETRDQKMIPSLIDENGVRFSSTGAVSIQSDIIVDRTDFPDVLFSQARLPWGIAASTGLGERLTFDEYLRQYVCDRKYGRAPIIAVNAPTGAVRSAKENVREVYGQAAIVEFYYPPSDPQTNANWSSLRVVFNWKKDNWYVLAVVRSGPDAR